MKPLDHKHLVKIVTSYTDREYISYLMEPVAHGTLEQFLAGSRSLSVDEQKMLRKFYGCLSGAVHYLHQKRQIRHRDLTARNILIYHDEVYISDFGSAYSWASRNNSATRHLNTPVSPDYMAPEVAKREERDSKSDMWSLGAVFLEMTTRLLGRRLSDLKLTIALQAKKSKSSPFIHANLPAVADWLQVLGKGSAMPGHDKEPLTWVTDLLQLKPEDRPSSKGLMKDILESPSFNIFCCFKCQPEFRERAFEYDAAMTREGPLGDSTDTRNTVAAMLGNPDTLSPFDSISTERSGSVAKWLGVFDGLSESAEMAYPFDADFVSQDPEDAGEQDVRGFVAEETDDIIYGMYEHNFYHEGDPWALNSETAQEAHAGPVELPGDTIWPKEDWESSPVNTQDEGNEKGLRDTGFGFMEYEDSSSDDCGEKRLFHEYSDASDTSSEDSLERTSLYRPPTCDTEIDGLETIEEQEEDGDQNDDNADAKKSAPLFDETSDDSDSEHEDEAEVYQESKAVPRQSEICDQQVPLGDDEKVSPVHDVGEGNNELETALITRLGASPETDVDSRPAQTRETRFVIISQQLDVPSSDSAFGEEYAELVSLSKPGQTTPDLDTQDLSTALVLSEVRFVVTAQGFVIDKRVGDLQYRFDENEPEHMDGWVGGFRKPTVESADEDEDEDESPESFLFGKEEDEQLQINTDEEERRNGWLEREQQKYGPLQPRFGQEPRRPQNITEPKEDRRARQAVRFFDPRLRGEKQAYSEDVEHNAPEPKRSQADSGTALRILVDPPPPDNSNESTQVRQPLSRANVKSFNADNKEPQKESTSPRSPRQRAALPGMNVNDFLQTTWESASSAKTSVMSENTRLTLTKILGPYRQYDRLDSLLRNYCKEGKVSAVKFLLHKGCNPGTDKYPRRGPLLAACQGASTRHNKCVRELINYKVNVNVKSRRTGKSALHIAIENDYFDGYVKLIRLLVDGGADTNVCDKNGDYPLTKLFSGTGSLPLEKHRLEALAILLKADTRVNVKAIGSGNSPLHLAVRRQDKWAVAMLIHKKADVNAKNFSDTTSLQLTANQFRGDLSPDHAQVLDLLLQADGILIDERAGALDRTALHWAVASNTAYAVRLLLEYRADPDLTDKDGNDAIKLAVKNAASLVADPDKIGDHVEIMTRITEAVGREWTDVLETRLHGMCAVESAVSTFCKSSGPSLLETLMMKGGLDPTAPFRDKTSILEFSKTYGTPEAVELLGSKG